MMITRGKSSFLTTFEAVCYACDMDSLDYLVIFVTNICLSVSLRICSHASRGRLFDNMCQSNVYTGFVCFSAFFGHD
jgi:hypothetical protein